MVKCCYCGEAYAESTVCKCRDVVSLTITERLQVDCGNLEIRSQNPTGYGTRVLINGKEIACVRLILEIGVDEATKATITYFPTLPCGGVTA